MEPWSALIDLAGSSSSGRWRTWAWRRSRRSASSGVSAAGEKSELDAADLELGGQRHQLGGVAGEALELVDGEDDRRLGRGLLELVGQRERLLQLGPDR
jgi:hypothetical protein